MENNKESQRILIDRAYLEWYSLNTLGILFKIPRDSIPNRHDTCSSDRKDQRIPKNPTQKRQCRTGPFRECRDSFEIPRHSESPTTLADPSELVRAPRRTPLDDADAPAFPITSRRTKGRAPSGPHLVTYPARAKRIPDRGEGARLNCLCATPAPSPAPRRPRSPPAPLPRKNEPERHLLLISVTGRVNGRVRDA